VARKNGNGEGSRPRERADQGGAQGVRPKPVSELLGHADVTTIQEYKTTSAAVSCSDNRQRYATARNDQTLSALDKPRDGVLR
jgi:hypothetical protein